MKNKLEASPAQFEQLVQLKLLEQKHGKPTPPSFIDLWSKANSAVAELIDTFPDQYWERAKKNNAHPRIHPKEERRI
jgi:hypothetical protein